MKEKNIISIKEAINACKKLKENNNTRISFDKIDNLIKDFEKDSVTC